MARQVTGAARRVADAAADVESRARAGDQPARADAGQVGGVRQTHAGGRRGESRGGRRVKAHIGCDLYKNENDGTVVSDIDRRRAFPFSDGAPSSRRTRGRRALVPARRSARRLVLAPNNTLPLVLASSPRSLETAHRSSLLDRAGGPLDRELDAVAVQAGHHVDLLHLPPRAR